MSSTNTENIFKIKPLQLIILFLLLQTCIAFLTDGFGFSFDEAMWQYIGRNWLRHGLTPYSGGVDNKSPLIFAVFGISDKLFGVNYWFPRLLGILCQSTGLFFVYRIGKHISGYNAGMIALTLYGLSLLWKSSGSKYVSYTETYAITCIIISFYWWLTAKSEINFFYSGLIAGLGAAFRFSAFFGIAAIFFISAKKNIKSSLFFSLGVLGGFALFLIFMVVTGINIHDFFFYALYDNFGAGSPTDHSALWRVENLVDKFFYSELILFYPAVLGYFFHTKKLDVFGIWLVCEFIGINIIGIYDRAHLKDFLPIFSITSAIFIWHMVEKYKVSLRQVMMIIWISFFPKVVEPFVGLKKIFKPPADKSESYCKDPGKQMDEDSKRKLGLWIKINSKENDKVLIAGMAAQIQVYAERLSPTIYFNATQTTTARKKFWNDINENKPAMVAIPIFADYEKNIGNDMRSHVSDLISKNYRLDTCMYGYSIYRKVN
ncbi:MAG: glycosyltransferase family 39 protein [Bacteroidetes bacterium]|nr:glycosyltransferase family 39 protein [Bacteroidota bacterium]